MPEHSGLLYRELVPRGQYRLQDKELYKALVQRQGGETCAICAKRHGMRVLHIDNNHETDQIRSLLCLRCNVMLGFIEKYPELIQPMIDYLEFWDNND